MKSSLRILHVEDNSNDAALVQSILEAGGIACVTTQVHRREEFVASLERGDIDLVLSDCSLPEFDGLAAAEIVRARWPDLPFIFVSGTLGEERAIDSLKNGATDYVLKDRLARLVPAVQRAMQEVAERAERRRLEAQFIEAQKMEVVGQLAGGVAHDFNNILAVIMGYSDMLVAALEPDSILRKHAEEIRHASERAVGLTRQLLVFSRKETVQPRVLDLNAEVGKLDKMLLRLVDENIEVAIAPGKPIGRIKADSGHIGQVLMNLVVNARDAMPNGGRLSIATCNVTLDKGSPALHVGATPGDYVMLSVSDTGLGMSEKVKARLFEPFFTTKPSGKGTGLGLTTCLTIVQQSNGCISVESEVGKGTTFKIYFPQVDQPFEAGGKPVSAGPPPRGTETLLIVEDEPSVRQMAREALELQGYKILSAANGRDALRLVQEYKESPIHLVITDVIMPLMGGKEMADSLRAIHPHLKILFTSGYTDETIAHHGVLDSGVQFLGKPYSSTTLAQKVREMLNSSPDK